MKKMNKLMALVLSLCIGISVLHLAVATSDFDSASSAESKITSELKNKFSVSRGGTVSALVWLSDVDLSGVEETALKVVGTKREETGKLGGIITENSTAINDNEVQLYIEAKRAASAELLPCYASKMQILKCCKTL